MFPWIIALLGFIACLYFSLKLLELCIRYEVRSLEIVLRLAGIPVMNIPFTSIKAARVAGPGELLPWRNPSSVGWLRFGNKLFHPAVIIEKTNGWFRTVVITPENPQNFLAHLSSKKSLLGSMQRWLNRDPNGEAAVQTFSI
jgi:hypothetical protein